MRHPNAHLMGQPKARERLATPALLLDLNVLDENLRSGAQLVGAASKSLRPHFKAHKCLGIARRQLDLGAVGLSVATISEAEVASILDTEILLTSVISTETQIDRAIKLHTSGVHIILVVDSIAVPRMLHAKLGPDAAAVKVLIDCDMGRHRSGVPSLEEARALGESLCENPSVDLIGLQAYAGHLSHLVSWPDRQIAFQKFCNDVDAIRQSLDDLLPASPILTGGSTGSLPLDINGPLTELQCGSYALMDIEYLNVEHPETGWPFDAAIKVQTSILSANWADHVTTDCGDKWLASKYGLAPQITRGAPDTAQYRAVSDEHGMITLHDAQGLSVGHKVEVIPPHCDPTINLFSAYHVFDQEKLVDIWPIAPRGS